jgi:single stranded DNA-binding protein
MYHSIQIIGRVSKDVILRDGDTSPVVTFSVATNRKYHTPDGKMEVQTHWFRVTVRGQQAVSCANILKKSDVVFIEGRLIADRDKGTPRIYEGNDGPNAAFEVLGEHVTFLPKTYEPKEDVVEEPA